MASIIEIILTFIGVSVALVYIFIKHKLSYWSRHGINSLSPSFPLGNFGKLFLQKSSMGEVCEELYNKSKESFIGVYITVRRAILIRDYELVRNILLKDFQYFHDRGFYCNETYDPLSGHLFALEGERWKFVRGKMTPAFTSGKLKYMFQTLVDTGYILQKYLKKKAENNDTIEIRDIMARYTTDIIASVAFGHESDSINDPNNIFRKKGKKFFDINFKNAVRFALNFFLPTWPTKLKIKSVDEDVEEFMLSLVKQTLEYREKNNISRKDFMQLLIQVRNSGEVLDDGKWDVKIADDASKKFSIKEVTAQAYVFFIAGFETSSTAMSFCLYELSKNQEIMKKVQKEMDDVLELHGNKIDYECLAQMKYLDSCIDETLRKYPPLSFLNRECTIPYKIPGTDVILPKGTPIIISILGLHHDPQFYANPMSFNPDRFYKRNEDKSLPYLPFGDGPRACIGSRMGKMLTKVGLFMMLSSFTFELGKDTPENLKMAPESAVMTPVGGIHLKISNRIR